MIHRVQVFRLLPDLTERQVLVFRMGGDQIEASAYGERLRTRWMELHPGHATTLRLDWPTSDELGEHHVTRPTPGGVEELELLRAKLRGDE
jgi:hypothetical protein